MKCLCPMQHTRHAFHYVDMSMKLYQVIELHQLLHIQQ